MARNSLRFMFAHDGTEFMVMPERGNTGHNRKFSITPNIPCKSPVVLEGHNGGTRREIYTLTAIYRWQRVNVNGIEGGCAIHNLADMIRWASKHWNTIECRARGCARCGHNLDAHDSFATCHGCTSGIVHRDLGEPCLPRFETKAVQPTA